MLNDLLFEASAVFANMAERFSRSFLLENRWMLYLEGLGNTLLMAALATALGIVIGFLIALIKVANRHTGRFRFLSAVCGVYLAVIRGTPVVVQLLIVYYIVFATAPLNMAIFIASLAFGMNSGAYVAEIVRAGIISVDCGQIEAGRSLGLDYSQTMRLIVLPQAVKNVIPPLFNEFIVLLKETSVAGYVAVRDITKAGDIVRSRTYDAFFPLLLVASIYLVLVLALTKLQQRLERRLGQSDSR